MNTKNILIVEDNANDLKWYRSLFSGDRNISLLFYNRDKNWTKERILELLELLYEDLFKSLQKCVVYDSAKAVEEFLKTSSFDFYIFDSLDKEAEFIIPNSGLPKEKIAILSSTTSFRGFIRERGYAAYRKADIDKLIQECFK